MADDPTWTADTTLGDWLLPRLSTWGEGAGTPVTSLVPGDYEAYARVFHPVEEDDDDGGGERTTWAQVCAAVGTTPHPAMQWSSIASAWDGAVPEVGSLPPSELAGVVDAPLLVVIRATVGAGGPAGQGASRAEGSPRARGRRRRRWPCGAGRCRRRPALPAT